MKWFFYENLTSGWHWRCENDEGKLVGHSTGFANEIECRDDAKRHGWPGDYVDPAANAIASDAADT